MMGWGGKVVQERFWVGTSWRPPRVRAGSGLLHPPAQLLFLHGDHRAPSMPEDAKARRHLAQVVGLGACVLLQVAMSGSSAASGVGCEGRCAYMPACEDAPLHCRAPSHTHGYQWYHCGRRRLGEEGRASRGVDQGRVVSKHLHIFSLQPVHMLHLLSSQALASGSITAMAAPKILGRPRSKAKTCMGPSHTAACAAKHAAALLPHIRPAGQKQRNQPVAC